VFPAAVELECWGGLYLHVPSIFQLAEFEFVEEKERNLVDGRIGGYVHSNFVVKGLDGAQTLFFAEIHPDCRKEEDVFLCTPLEGDDSGKAATIWPEFS
jgi:hypothetical protein